MIDINIKVLTILGRKSFCIKIPIIQIKKPMKTWTLINDLIKLRMLCRIIQLVNFLGRKTVLYYKLPFL